MKKPFGGFTGNFDTLHAAMKDSLKSPFIGVTQGGSSRTKGAKVAATTAANKPKGTTNGRSKQG